MDYYTIRDTDAGNSCISAFGKHWVPDRVVITGPSRWRFAAVSPELVGKRVYQFTDDLRRECLQVEDVPGRAGRFTVVYENQGA